MRRVFSLLLIFSATLLLCAAAARTQSRQAEPRPPAPCDDDLRKELYGRFLKNHKGSPEQKLEAYRTAEEYVCRCAEYDDVTLYLSYWMASYASPDYFYPNAEAAAEAVAREDAKRPRCRCDEMREQLMKSLGERYKRYRDDTSEQNFKTAKRFLNICGDIRRPFDRDLRDWLGKYGRAVREFEEKRQKVESPAKGPTKEQ